MAFLDFPCAWPPYTPVYCTCQLGLRSTLLFILLSFSVLIENYRPVSATILGITLTGLAGFSFFKWLSKPWKHMGYFLVWPDYGARVYQGKYTQFATSDDIVSGKYVFLNLASNNYGRFITVTPQPPDKENYRTDIKLFEVKSHEFDKYPKKLTIGCVKFYVRRLQCNLKYEYRRVFTYVDEAKRRCILIESFNQSGERMMKRIYRERDLAWWYDMIIDEKETSLAGLTSFGLFKSSETTTFQLELYSDILPVCITRSKFSHGFYFFFDKGSGKPKQLTEIQFANEPIQPSKHISDLLIWHYFELKDPKNFTSIQTSLVVICELFETGWQCKYYKCMNQERREYKVYDSLSYPFDDNINFSHKGSQIRPHEKFEVMFDLTQKNVPGNIDKFALHIYPESNHYTLRPLDLNKPTLPSSVRTNDPGGKSQFFHNVDNCFRLVCISYYGKIRLISYTALDSTNLLFNTIIMKNEPHNAYELFYEAGSRPYLEALLSPYYMSLSIKGKTLNVDHLDLDLTKLDGILTAKLNDNVTFYSSLYSQYKILKSLKIDSEVLEVSLDINSQLFYCEKDNSKFLVISHVNKELTIMKRNGNKFVNVAINTMQDLLNNVKLAPILNSNYQKNWNLVTLNLDDIYISEHIDVLISSYNTVTFKTQYGMRINVINWKGVEINVKEGWPMVTKIMYMDHHLLLIDTVKKDKIDRELYKLDVSNHKIILLSNILINITLNDLDNLAKQLSQSIYNLYPNTLPIKISFENPKTIISEFEVDKIQIAHSDADLMLTPGDLTAHGKEYKVPKNHKWKQVFKYQGHNNSDFYDIFTMVDKGMYHYHSSDDKKEQEEFPRDPFLTITGKYNPLLIESVYLPGVKIQTAKIGTRNIITYTSETDAILNPIIFGKHEIKLIGDLTNVQVVKSFDDNNKCSITIEAKFKNNNIGTLTFTQNAKSPELYKLEDRKDLGFVDDSLNFLDLVKGQTAQELINFNERKFPLDLRYMILNKIYYYFTGFTRTDKFEIYFGDQKFEILKANIRYNIWVRYPYDDVTSSVIMLSYLSGDKLKTFSATYDSHGKDIKIERPNVKFNWGILSNMEALLVNRALINMAAHKEEIFPVDLKIDDTPESVIMKLKVDDNTVVYTTLSKCNCVINNIRYKNAVIKGFQKQLAKQVFVSSVNNEIIIVIATKTISKALLNAYLFKNDTFDIIDVSKIDCGVHKGLRSFQMCG
ncbi:conserved hypothetical protein [Theileria orientalis strain Shintoku]|uniref:Uncharacterized protein n=1 Tax=Theileria orientalis strain Shintoku TaxID=869250 RepID=J7MBX3_THEOR|nr:conserved hypothetical protein [Theileria orientalis strain Shintoku]BAM38662.1 conserved hypothetical protein [Theileria orientalis strain Shintoku]|eukprot:XP_009688963.1 conserved hypothetical protein [Theileria orientalis strain Shintoku]